MDKLSNISVLKQMLERHGFSFSKGLGQNFLINPSVCPRMAELGNAQPGWGVIEIGAGIGVLTAELAQRADKVVCIEIDKRLLPILDETLSEYDNIKIINQDVLKVDLAKLITDEFEGKPIAICANLPYYITSPIIMNILEAKLPVESITIMVQKEAAQRICAAPGKREVGAISLAIQYYSDPKVLFQVSRGSFMPAPDVDSTVIRLDIRKSPPIEISDEIQFFHLVKGAFSQRRKTLLNTLSSYYNIEKERLKQAIESTGTMSNMRAEQLTMEEFGKISSALCSARILK